MTTYENIGKVFELEDKSLFAWRFDNKWLLWKPVDTLILSPHFCLPDSRWYLCFYPYGSVGNGSEGWLGVFLVRADRGPQKNMQYVLNIKIDNYCNKTFTKTHCFNPLLNHSGEVRLLEMSTLKIVKLMYLQTEITCRIKDCDKGTPKSVSCGIQAEISDCVIDGDDPNRQDGSLLDMKEITILRDCMKKLIIKGNDHDLTISVKDKKFQAHRSILSARSSVFAMMLTHDTKESKTSTINIEDCDPETFEDFLLYVYSGRTENLTPSKALQLYYTADKYNFPVLKERCVSLLKTSLSVTSIFDVILLAAKYQEKELLELASVFFALNMEEILVSVSWQTFLIQNPLVANELYIKSMKLIVPTK